MGRRARGSSSRASASRRTAGWARAGRSAGAGRPELGSSQGAAKAIRTTSRSRRRHRPIAAEVLPLPERPAEERPVLVVDLGGQYAQLIARRVRECRVYSELVGHGVTAAQVRARNPHAVILSGGPASVYAEGAPHVDPEVFALGIPTLGICYGAQLLALDLGGTVERTGASEFGKTELTAVESELFSGLPDEETVWMSHRDTVTAPPIRRSPRWSCTRRSATSSRASSSITACCARTRPSRWWRRSTGTSVFRSCTCRRRSGSCHASRVSTIRSRSGRSSAKSSSASSKKRPGNSDTFASSSRGRSTPT